MAHLKHTTSPQARLLATKTRLLLLVAGRVFGQVLDVGNEVAALHVRLQNGRDL
jgi:hypothetical protein